MAADDETVEMRRGGLPGKDGQRKPSPYRVCGWEFVTHGSKASWARSSPRGGESQTELSGPAHLQPNMDSPT